MSLGRLVRLDATLTDATVDLIETGTDVAVRIGALLDSTVIARKWAPRHRILVASPDYLDGRPPLTAPSDLADHECLLFTLQPNGTWYHRSKGDSVGSEPIEVSVTNAWSSCCRTMNG